jgi:hypothetical protein
VWSSDPVRISADEALAAAAKKVTFGAVDFLQQALSEGPMDQTEIVRRGREAGFSEKNLRTAREKLGVTPRKEGFGAGGRWVWVPAGGASVLRLAVNNGANGHTAGAADKTAPDADHVSGTHVCADRNDPDVLADERVPFAALVCSFPGSKRPISHFARVSRLQAADMHMRYTAEAISSRLFAHMMHT